MAELGPQRKQGIRKGKPYGVKSNRSLTATFAECGENEAGMEMLGKIGSLETAIAFWELPAIKAQLEAQGHTCWLHAFHERVHEGPLGAVSDTLPAAGAVPESGVLVVRGLFSPEQVDAAEVSLWDDSVPIDTMALMGKGPRRAVMNKNGRHNNCMTERASRPRNIATKEDYAEGKGSVLALEDFPEVNTMRKTVEGLVQRDLGVVENNYYFNPGPANGIGWHGDKERRVAVLLRLGSASVKMPLNFQYFYNFKPFGPIFQLPLRHGDVVIMSRVAVGTDWMEAPRKRWTMRHAAGVGHSKPKDKAHAFVMQMHEP